MDNHFKAPKGFYYANKTREFLSQELYISHLDSIDNYELITVEEYDAIILKRQEEYEKLRQEVLDSQSV